jgi:hypothetical protein
MFIHAPEKTNIPPIALTDRFKHTHRRFPKSRRLGQRHSGCMLRGGASLTCSEVHLSLLVFTNISAHNRHGLLPMMLILNEARAEL